MSKTKNNMSLLSAVLTGGILAMLIAGGISLLLAWIVSKERLPQNTISLAPPLVIGAAVFAAVLIVLHHLPRQQKLPAAIGTGAVYLLFCFLVKLVLFPGNYDHFLRNLLVILLAALIACIVSCAKKKRTNFRREHRHR